MTTVTAPPPGRVWLDPDHLACDGCGIPVPAGVGGSMATETIVTSTDRHGNPTAAARVGRCPSCAGLHATARHLDPDRPLPLVMALACYRIVGRPLPEKVDVSELRRWLGGFDPLWSSLVWAGTERPGTAPATPWGHVDDRVRSMVRTQLARWARVRAGRPVKVPCPSGGCLLCGVDSIGVPADRAHAIPEGLWRPVSADPGVLGGNGGRRVAGSLCPDCDAAALDPELGVRVLGPTARETALVAWWESTGLADEARMVRHGLVGPPAGWAVTGLPPNAVPWGHVEVPELDGAR